MSRRGVAVLVAALCVTGAQCSGGGDARRPPVAVRDSAGIKLVDVRARALDSLPRWSLDTAPLEIGAAQGASEYLLHRAATPVRLSDGRIAVANGQSEIRFYDSTGRYERTVGGRGEGPGQYRQLWSLYRLEGDSLLALDAIGKVSVLDREGRFIRSEDLNAQAYYPLALVWLSDRSAIYLADWAPRVFRRLAGPATQVVQDTAPLVRLTADWARHDTLAWMPAGWFVGRGGGVGDVALAGEPLVATGSGGVVAGHGDAFTVRWFDVAGALRRIVRVSVTPRNVTPADRRAYDSALAVLRRRFRAEGGGWPEVRYAAHRPVISRLRMGADGTLWVQRWAPEDAAVVEWLVFGPDGVPRARLETPAKYSINEVGSDYVLGVFRDDMDVESVRLYRVRRR